MGMPIKDGTGTGVEAQVNAYKQLEVAAAGMSRQAYISRTIGEAFSWTAVSADIDTTDTMLLVANTNATKKLYITKIYCWADVAAQFQIHLPAYPTLAGTAVTGVCLNRAMNQTAQASAYADETGNSQGSIIKTLRNNETATDEFGVDWDFEGSVILGYHNSIAIDVVGEVGAFECSIEGYYE